jgi:hypothetical protein
MDEAGMTSSSMPLLALLLAAVPGVNGGAQAADGVLGVDDGKRGTTIARVVNGRWVDGAPCALDDAGSAHSDSGERLTVSGGLTSAAVRAVGPGSAEWRRLSPAIVQAFDRREREQRLTSDRTGQAPRAIDWIYAFDQGSEPTYYFEASRRVAGAADDVDADTDPPGTIRIAVAGFLRESRGGPIAIGTKGELRWEQDGLPAGPRRPDLMPLGVVTYLGRSVWVMKGRSGTSTWFMLYDVSAEGARTTLTARVTRC